MKVIISGRRTEATERLKELIEKKLSKLDKFFSDSSEAKVTLTGEKGDRVVTEVTVFSDGMIYRAEETAADAFTAIDKIVTVIERQIRRNKTRLEKRLRENAFDPANFRARRQRRRRSPSSHLKEQAHLLKADERGGSDPADEPFGAQLFPLQERVDRRDEPRL